jgi:hypothetical protein
MMLNRTLATLAVALSLGTLAGPSLAHDELALSGAQAVKLKDGSVLHMFPDGKMALEDRWGRPAYLQRGTVLEAVDGRRIPATGNEVALLDRLMSGGHRN